MSNEIATKPDEIETLLSSGLIQFEAPYIKTVNLDRWQAKIADIVQKTTNRVITADNKTELKKELAQLRKIKNGINQKRVKAQKDYDRPFIEEKLKIDQLVKQLEGPIKQISSAVDELDQHDRAVKQTMIEALIKELAVTYDVNPEQITIDEKWLNKSTSQIEIERAIVEGIKLIKKRAKQPQQSFLLTVNVTEAKKLRKFLDDNQIEYKAEVAH